MGPVHFAMTLALLNAARFEVLNQTKLTLISRQFVKQGDVPGMDGLKPHERWFGEWIKPGEDVPNLKLGIPVGKAFLQSEKLEMALSVLKNDNYLLSYNTSSRTACIVLHKSAGANDIIKAILHSIKLDHDIRQLDSNDALSTEELKSLLQSSHSWTKEKFPKFVAELDAKDWESDAVFWGDTGSRVEWDRGTEDLEGDATAAKPKSE
ncbi:hypothetical protein HK097_004663 [Rhizophlyctis rosea]|uniref:Root UVB sensitive protein C-terminal domain-containing protein n=1 Tax=Rhizophlyctis rosea TaxID=64517 RepID=A0AAD5SFH3_9FUNG|nr:hypothetical protein HK097_004663 [Rhizophlyctis rosea]